MKGLSSMIPTNVIFFTNFSVFYIIFQFSCYFCSQIVRDMNQFGFAYGYFYFYFNQ
ncbi:MAG: hypothetical protein BWY72_00078 [Bacteroidetes bacterium ADurb.Bin416]|nr:MAG: hypothetical protein BWY72_00078 [Bacteroidetes bacterium ADurb.Bin416]